MNAIVSDNLADVVSWASFELFKVTNNVAYDIFGMCYFVEDGAERGTIFKKNLGAVIKKVENGFFEDTRLV